MPVMLQIIVCVWFFFSSRPGRCRSFKTLATSDELEAKACYYSLKMVPRNVYLAVLEQKDVKKSLYFPTDLLFLFMRHYHQKSHLAC